MPARSGSFTILGYRSTVSPEEFLVLTMGELNGFAQPLVRIQSQCLTGEVFGSQRCDCGPQLEESMRLIAEEGAGVVVYQMQEGRGIGLLNKLRAYELQDAGADTVEANERLGFAVDARDYGQCAEILLDLGIAQVRILSNNPLKIRALEEGGVKVGARVALEPAASVFSLEYLRSKKLKMGHLLTLE
jgi:3,4-dihydroxy 2-butanone 4-phosphate synthase/GTP cyclohydrolase II